MVFSPPLCYNYANLASLHCCVKVLLSIADLNKILEFTLHCRFYCWHVCVCVHACVCMCMHACARVRACMHVHVCVCMHNHVCLPSCLPLCVCVCVHACVHACMCVCACMCPCVCVYDVILFLQSAIFFLSSGAKQCRQGVHKLH